MPDVAHGVTKQNAVEWLIDRVNLSMVKSIINKNKGVVLLPWILEDEDNMSFYFLWTDFKATLNEEVSSCQSLQYRTIFMDFMMNRESFSRPLKVR